jgi:histidinol-phosphatase
VGLGAVRRLPAALRRHGGGRVRLPLAQLSGDLDLAHRLADAADAITLGRFRARDLHVESKPDLTPVSEADRAAEEAVRDIVARSGRGEAVFGEEYGEGLQNGRAGDARWIVDPIDGTKSYVRGIPAWATLLALEREGAVMVGLVSAPALGRRWWAERGGGAHVDGARCAVSAISRIEDAIVSTTAARHMPAGWRRLAARAWAERGWGDFWQHCLVAEGAVEVGSDASLALWDYAAVRLIVEEAGGRCSTFAGAPPAPGESFLSTNGVLHDEVVASLGS